MKNHNLAFQAETQLPTAFGYFRFRVYKNSNSEEVIAIVTRGIENQQSISVRIHSACFTAEVMGSLKCDCKQQLDFALGYIAEHGGVVIYLPQEGRGIGLSNKIRAYALQEDGHDTIAANHLLGLPADDRRYDDAAFILQDLNVRQLRLITNNPNKLEAMREFGFAISGRIPVPATTNRHSHSYLETKRAQMGHLLSVPTFYDTTMEQRETQAFCRPFVHINFALDADGYMNKKNGQMLELSCAQDWQRVHALRERYAAVVVGANTWIRDRPQLNVRENRLGRTPQRQPDRVIFAGDTHCPVKPDDRRSFVIGASANANHQTIHITAESRDLKEPLQRLFTHQIDSLLVEGGMTLLNSFIQQAMVDRITIYVLTESQKVAAAAVAKQFPELATEAAEAVPFGRGILLSYTPGITQNLKVPVHEIAAFSANRVAI